MVTHNGIYWPGKISWEEEVSGKSEARHSRDAWCYGAPGVVRSLFLAGSALKNKTMAEQALLGMQSIFNRAFNEWGIFAPTICHGFSGLLLVTHLMAEDTQDARLQTRVEELEKHVWGFYRPETFFGFQDFELKKDGGHAPLDKAGMLEGVMGVLLTLLTVNGSPSRWHYPLLISRAS